MNTSLRLMSWAALACLLVACKQTSSNYCCLSADTCEGGSITPCEDPARPFCDEAGEFGPRQGCVADPLASDCETPADCTTAERPFCVEGRCVECENSGDCSPASPVCETDTGLCGACSGDNDCAARAETPRCLVDDGACVACLDNGDCGEATAPVCGDDNACRACREHDECGSQVCDRDTGACVDEAAVIYLAPTGQASGTCTRTTPCTTFALGLAQVSGTRTVIKAAPGEYTGVVDIDGIDVTIYGDGATAQPSGENQTVVTVEGGASAAIHGLTVTLARGPALPYGIICTGATSRLVLRGATVIANTGAGGISITSCEFSIVNSVIALNGGVTSTTGGVSISQISAGTLHEFEFNTVTGNTGISGANTGVDCSNVFIPISLKNSIVYNNTVGGAGAQVGGDADCAWTYSDIGPQTVAGTGNINMDPMFVEPINRDYHLQSGSPARDVADPAATLTIDIDGDPRPAGDGHDMGADEVQ